MKRDESRNYRKYMEKNPIKLFLLNNFFKAIYEILYGIKFNTLLDVGCGEGFDIERISSKYKHVKITGLDISKNALEVAKKRNRDCRFIQGDASNLKFSKNSFDLVMALEILEHVKEPNNVLEQIKRVSRKYCIISVPNEPWFSISNLLRGKNVKSLGRDIEHIHFWEKKEIVHIAKKFFSIEKVVTPFPWVIMLCRK